MTYESRLPANYSFGTLTNAVAVGDTNLVSADFASRIPTGLSTTVYVPITLQNQTTGAFEIVWANAHAAASTTISCLRGREATAAQTWPSGTLWTVAPTLRDGVLPLANRAALPTDPHVGMRCYLQDEQITIERFLPCWGAPIAELRQAASQTVAHNTPTIVQFGAEDIDTAGGHDLVTNNSRYTCKLAGWYLVAGGAGFNGGTGNRNATFYKNGVQLYGGHGWIVAAGTAGIASAFPARTRHVQLALGDYLEMVIFQDGGVPLATSMTAGYETTMSVRYVGGV